MRSRPQRIAAGVVFGLLFGIGFLPLFGGPGYEHALASGLVVPSAAAIATALDVARAEDVSPSAAVGRGVASGLALASVAFATALIHGLRVGFCDLAGAAFDFALSAGFGAVLGGAWGAIAGEACRRARRVKRVRLACTLLAIAAPLAGVAVSLWRFYTSPMIFAFDPFVGYFSGTLYDTVIDAGTSLLTYRVGSLASLTALALAASVTERREGRLRIAPLGGHPGRGARLALALAALAVSVGITIAGPALGHWQTSATIAKDLGGRREGARCDVVYPDGERPDEVDLMVRDCEEQLAQVEATLGARGPSRVTAFFFRDAADKKRLMGAAETYIAKPWRREVYVQRQGYPHPVLGHELAHVVAGSFGRGPFRIAGAAGGLWPNPGLIEGVAVAASPDAGELTGAEWARAMLDLGILPNVSKIFSLGFLGESSAKSYTIAGAFVGWVKGERGAEIVRRWYGGADLTALTGLSWSALDEAFRAHLRSLALPPEALAYAKAKFDRPSVFGRRCPHVVDALRREADRCRDELRIDRALPLYGDVLARDPHDVAARFGRGVTEARFGDAARGRAELEALAAAPATPRTWRDRIDETLADLDLLDEKWEAARAAYQALAARTLDEDAGRTLDVKAYAAGTPAGRDAIMALLVGTKGRPVDLPQAMARLGAWSEATHDPVAEYVLGRNLAQRGYWREGGAHLDEAARASEPTPRITRELVRQRAIVACVKHDAAALDQVRAALADDTGPFSASRGRRDAIARLVDRCAKTP